MNHALARRWTRLNRLNRLNHLGLAALLSLAGSLYGAPAGATDPPTSWSYPLLPHVQALAFNPSTPNSGGPTGVWLSSTYTGECWMVLDYLTEVDAEHISMTLAPNDTCYNDSLSGWGRGYTLGMLSEGIHPLTITATILHGALPSTQEQTTIGFEVVYGNPPPPPPVPPDTSNTLVTYVEVLPPYATIDTPITVRVNGRYPFDCGQILNPLHSGNDLTLTLAPGTCADTMRVWSYEFALGLLPAGRTTLMLDVAAQLASGTRHELHGVNVDVTDPDSIPPPPPPPIDSLYTGLSQSRPNPFSDESRFSVSVNDAQQAQVDVFDLGGRRVANVFRGVLPAGTSQLAWNGRRADGSRAPGGIYFYRVTLPNRVLTRRVILLGTP